LKNIMKGLGFGWPEGLLAGKHLFPGMQGLGVAGMGMEGLAKLKALLAAMGLTAAATAVLQKTTGLPGQAMGLLADAAGKLKTALLPVAVKLKATVLPVVAVASDKTVGAASRLAAAGKSALRRLLSAAADKPAMTDPKSWANRSMSVIGLASGGTLVGALAGLFSMGPAGWASVAAGVAAFGLWHLLRQLLRESGGDSALRVRRRKVELADRQDDESEAADYSIAGRDGQRRSKGDSDREQGL
jgi:hypothetical protein